MAQSIIIRNGEVINEGTKQVLDIYIKDGRILQIAPLIDKKADVEIDAFGKWVIPGIIDDQVHFREPGFPDKADIFSESRAAVAGGVTSFMEMPNTKPNAITQALLADKYEIGRKTSLANYSFFMGATNDNIEEVLKTNPKDVCGVKIFMGASTGNMLVDETAALEQLFSQVPMLIATHCEDEATIRRNMKTYEAKYGADIPFGAHPLIRSAEGCYISSSLAVGLAKKYDARLHILHISTKDEIALFDNQIPLKDKRITSEVCVHHLFFNSDDYEEKGALIKCNPAIKSREHQEALFPALLDNHLDIIATDHAPHTWDEKHNKYAKAPSGLPLVQHAINVMLHFQQQGKISIERIVEKMCHAPAICFNVKDRGYLREGYWADVAIIDPQQQWKVAKDNVLYHCGWSPLEGQQFQGRVTHTIVSGHLAFANGVFDESKMGKRLLFARA